MAHLSRQQSFWLKRSSLSIDSRQSGAVRGAVPPLSGRHTEPETSACTPHRLTRFWSASRPPVHADLRLAITRANARGRLSKAGADVESAQHQTVQHAQGVESGKRDPDITRIGLVAAAGQSVVIVLDQRVEADHVPRLATQADLVVFLQ